MILHFLYYTLACLGVTYIFITPGLTPNHLWRWWITIVAVALDTLRFFAFLEFMESKAVEWYGQLTKSKEPREGYGAEKNWTIKFLTLYDCYICGGLWIDLILSWLIFDNIPWWMHFTNACLASTIVYLFLHKADN